MGPTLRKELRCPGGDDAGSRPYAKCMDRRDMAVPKFWMGTGQAPAAYSYGTTAHSARCFTRAPRCTLHGAVPPAATAPSSGQSLNGSAEGSSAPSGSAECWRGAAFAAPAAAGGGSGRCAGRATPPRPNEAGSVGLAALSGAM
eukprot:gene10635-biopygen7658